MDFLWGLAGRRPFISVPISAAEQLVALRVIHQRILGVAHTGGGIHMIPGTVNIDHIPVMGLILAPDQNGLVALLPQQRLQAQCVDIAVAVAIFKAVPHGIVAAVAVGIGDIVAYIITQRLCIASQLGGDGGNQFPT